MKKDPAAWIVVIFFLFALVVIGVSLYKIQRTNYLRSQPPPTLSH